MRRSFGRKVNKSNKDRLYTIFAFFVIAPIISIVLAFLLVQNVIIPRLDEDQKANSTIEEGISETGEGDIDLNNDTNIADNVDITKPDKPEEIEGSPSSGQVNAEETTFFSVQIGNFSSVTNAQALINDLKENNINDGYIVNVEDSYKVFAGEFQIKEDAYNYLENIREFYEDAFMNTVSSNDKVLE